MKREDAIKTLKELWRETNDPWYEEVYNMAINALEADRKTEPTCSKMEQVEDEPLTCRNKDHYADCEYKDNCNSVVCFKALDEFREMVTKSQTERSE